MLRDREAVVRRLTAKPVARAVRWYDPGVLVRVGYLSEEPELPGRGRETWPLKDSTILA